MIKLNKNYIFNKETNMQYKIYEYKSSANNCRKYVFKTMIDDYFVVLKFVIQDNHFILEFTVDKKVDWDTLCICTSTDIQYYKSWKNVIKLKKQKIDINDFNGSHKILMSERRIQICEDIINFAFKKMFIFFGL